ncbi:hypothetical protein C8J56DRAFT_1006031 [Mycena floridula]|nr:hypothetical protein C8J56DRAFT_1006031 [Mycena floridula]
MDFYGDIRKHRRRTYAPLAHPLQKNLCNAFVISGGGIGGVTLAIALSRYPEIDFNLYESAAAFEEIGAAVGIFGRSLDAPENMGVAAALEKIQTPFRNSEQIWQYRKADIYPTGQEFARRSGAYHRAQLLSLLVSLLPKEVQEEHIHFKKRLSRYDQGTAGTPIVLYFADDTTAECDILIGADGIKSPTRHGIFAERAALEPDETRKERILKWSVPRWTGMVAYRGLIASVDIEVSPGQPHRCSNNLVFYCGKNAHLIVFPILERQMLNVVAFVSKDRPWVELAPQGEMLEAYSGFEEEVLLILKALKAPSRWAIHELDPLPFYTKGNVAVLGDAAHATQPHLGQGANQSIEDAYVLSLILASPETTKLTIPRALKAYERARLERANEIIRSSSKIGKMYQYVFGDPGENKHHFG